MKNVDSWFILLGIAVIFVGVLVQYITPTKKGYKNRFFTSKHIRK